MYKRLSLHDKEYILKYTLTDKGNNVFVRIDNKDDLDFDGYKQLAVNINENTIDVIISSYDNIATIVFSSFFYIAKDIDAILFELIQHIRNDYKDIDIIIGLSIETNNVIIGHHLTLNKQCSVDTILDNLHVVFESVINNIDHEKQSYTDIDITQYSCLKEFNIRKVDIPKGYKTDTNSGKEGVMLIDYIHQQAVFETVDKKLIQEETPPKPISATHLFHPDDTLPLNRIFRYTITEFKKRFPNDNVLPEVFELLEKYNNQGIVYDEVVVVIKHINNIISDTKRNDSVNRKFKKTIKPILKDLNTIKISYLIYPKDYKRSKQTEHYRSGHWRRYKSGKVIWINTYKAGTKK